MPTLRSFLASATDAWMQELWRRGEYARGMKKSDKKLRRKMRAFKYRGVAVK